MKKQILSVLLAGAALSTQAQVQDKVSIGAGYANQVWYSLQNDEQKTQPKDNWDLAFDGNSIYSSIHVNTAAGVMLWNYPKGDKTAWSSIDTNGLSTWEERYNSETDWEVGAMGRYGDRNAGDLDWGIYDQASHKVSGDSIYIIQLVNGDFKKLFIEELLSGTFTFKFADLDGSNEKTAQVKKSDFKDKNLGYYSIVNETGLANREPDMDDWDLVFTQYTAFIMTPAPVPYGVTGVLHNRGVKVAKVSNLPNKQTYNNYQQHTFNSEINTIGYNWKSFNGSGYDIKDSTVFFISSPDAETGDDAIWKVIFTGFASADGEFEFEKTLLKTASIKDAHTGATTLALAPNPTNGQNVQVVYDLENNMEEVMLSVTDMTGKTIMVRQLEKTAGLHTYAIPSSSLSSGMYIVSVNTRGGSVQQKLMVN